MYDKATTNVFADLHVICCIELVAGLTVSPIDVPMSGAAPKRRFYLSRLLKIRFDALNAWVCADDSGCATARGKKTKGT